jgi:hypothetical protein
MASLTYNPAKVSFAKGEIAWVSDTIRAVLLTSTYTPNQDTDQYWSDISTHEFSGGSYSAGGIALTTKAVTQDNTNDRAVLDSDDVQFTGITGTFRYVALVKWTGIDSTSRLIRLIDPEGAIITLTNGTYDLTVPVGGWISLQ